MILVFVGNFQKLEIIDEFELSIIQSLIDKFKSNIQILFLVKTNKAIFTTSKPFDFNIRKIGLEKILPESLAISIPDSRDEAYMNLSIDSTIEKLYSAVLSIDSVLVIPMSNELPYNGKYKYYRGSKFESSKIEDIAETLRDRKEHKNTYSDILIGNDSLASRDLRKGIMYTVNKKYPTGYPTVDIAITNFKNELLMAKKPDDTQWRFIGGFFDPLVDDSLEDAAYREFTEETGGGKALNLQFVTSYKVGDSRYMYDKDKIITTLFHGKLDETTTVNASDDIDTLKWISPEDQFKFYTNSVKHVISTHRILFEKFYSIVILHL